MRAAELAQLKQSAVLKQQAALQAAMNSTLRGADGSVRVDPGSVQTAVDAGYSVHFIMHKATELLLSVEATGRTPRAPAQLTLQKKRRLEETPAVGRRAEMTFNCGQRYQGTIMGVAELAFGKFSLAPCSTTKRLSMAYYFRLTTFVC